ncbi:MAG: hypothetical protein WAM82_12630 [Thermoanaerobaculia bacterium]
MNTNIPLTRRGLLRLAGGAALAACSPAWLQRAAFAAGNVQSGQGGGVLKAFTLPAGQNDFPGDPRKHAALAAKWSQTLAAFTEQAIIGDPWTVENDHDRSWYVNPLKTAIPGGSPVVPVFWTAFPNRLSVYFAASEKSPYKLTGPQVLELADYGKLAQVSPFDKGLDAVNVPSRNQDICPYLNWQSPQDQWSAYPPEGPRGWLDEYCEWSVTRNSQGKITRVMFTCENPEYWLNLWSVDPRRVVELYNSVLFPGQRPRVAPEDLYLHDKLGAVVTDPLTGGKVYNPLNRWNSGTQMTADGGGAMHLTSPPNTIGAEIYLAAAATLLRQIDDEGYNEQSMICCAEYGAPFRNSDPNIGFSVNQVVRNGGLMGTLTDPVGLYIQRPDFSNYEAPGGHDPAKFWTVVRGRTATQAGESYDQILHANFEVPEELGFTVGDLKINGQPILFAGQIAQTFHIALAATGIAARGAPKQAPLPCPANRDQGFNPWPQLLLPLDVYNAYNDFNPNEPLPQLALEMTPGSSATLALLVVGGTPDAKVEFTDPGIKVEVFNSLKAARPPRKKSHFGPGDSYTYHLKVQVGNGVKPGGQGLRVINSGAQPQRPIPGFLTIVAKR